MERPRHAALFILASIFGPLACATSTDAESIVGTPKVVLAPTTANAVPGQDFHDAHGRLWRSKGKVEFLKLSPSQPASPPNYTPTPGFVQKVRTMSVAELAAALRPRRLVGQYEYELAEPDFEVAEKVLAMTSVPTTDGHAPTVTSAPDISPQFVIGTDDRVQVNNSTVWPGSAFAHLSQGCTATMIGPSTALCAAHCFYIAGRWIESEWIAFGQNNWSTATSPTTPFGSYLADSLTMPGAWDGSWSEASKDWDFAVLEFWVDIQWGHDHAAMVAV